MSLAAAQTYCVKPGGQLSGTIDMPGDKSISHRAVILGAIAEGQTIVENFCPGADCIATMHALQALGAQFEYQKDQARLLVHGVGMRGLRAPRNALDLGNSGTGIRLLCGLLAGMGVSAELTGDESLRARPMQHIVEPLNKMGARILTKDGKAPLRIEGSGPLKGMRHRSSIGSAQLKSCLLLAGLYAKGHTELDVPESRDHTERMLPCFGCPVSSHGGLVGIEGDAVLHATKIVVPGDISAAMFVLVGASITAGSDVLVRAVGINPRRDGGIRILQAMGADINIVSETMFGEEPVADIRVRGTDALKGIEVPPEWVIDAIDEFPILFIAAACAHGVTRARGIDALRVKESDRINTMAKGLQALGIEVRETADSLSIHGGSLTGGSVESAGDHRAAMAFAISGLVARAEVRIHDCANVETSWPLFATQLDALGLGITTIN